MTTTQSDSDRADVERATGDLFSELWGPYDRELFEQSVALFERRLRLAEFDLSWFPGKTCLDAGCGGGRNAIAMGRFGAQRVVGLDVGAKGLQDARRRAEGQDNVTFQVGSILDMPFADNTFDLVWCAGVVMHTVDPLRALRELHRVVRPGGYVYLLVYNTGGMRWPLMNWLRPVAQQIGGDAIHLAAERAELPANKRRTVLDDLFVPEVDQFLWTRLRSALESAGFEQLDRWAPETRLDHEHSLTDYATDLKAYLRVFESGCALDGDAAGLFTAGAAAVRVTLDTIAWFEQRVTRGELSESEAMHRVIGDGHHRVMCRKAASASSVNS